MLSRIYFSFLLFLFSCSAIAQVHFHDAAVKLHDGAVINIWGNVAGTTNIVGSGWVQLVDSVSQNLDWNGFSINRLKIKNQSDISLLSDVAITDSISFIDGKMTMNDYAVLLNQSSAIEGADWNHYFNTNGSGKLMRYILVQQDSIYFPVGNEGKYRPAYLSVQSNQTNTGILGVSFKNNQSVHQPIRIRDFSAVHWPVMKQGIDGDVFFQTHYSAIEDVVGSEPNLSGYFFNGINWTSAQSQINHQSNVLHLPIVDSVGEVNAMNKFVLLGAEVMLQGAYNPVSGLMNDSLRSPHLLIPYSDPYRGIIFRSAFTHTDNPVTETISPVILNNQALEGNNIVDWIFLELRDTSAAPNNHIIQTRSALLQRDGDVVEIDGTSPVAFNDIPDGHYTLTVRHRNHLGLSMEPTIANLYLTESNSNVAQAGNADFIHANSDVLYGSDAAHTIGFLPSGQAINLLWSGNNNDDDFVRYAGKRNDRLSLLQQLNLNEQGSESGYYRSDINMNGKVDYGAVSSDASFLLNVVLEGNQLKVIKEEKLP